jgi:hypothetical protein
VSVKPPLAATAALAQRNVKNSCVTERFAIVLGCFPDGSGLRGRPRRLATKTKVLFAEMIRPDMTLSFCFALFFYHQYKVNFIINNYYPFTSRWYFLSDAVASTDLNRNQFFLFATLLVGSSDLNVSVTTIQFCQLLQLRLHAVNKKNIAISCLRTISFDVFHV